MNQKLSLDSIESIESYLEQIETEYIVSDKDKPVISNLIQELLALKVKGNPSEISPKWDEINTLLKTFEPASN